LQRKRRGEKRCRRRRRRRREEHCRGRRDKCGNFVSENFFKNIFHIEYSKKLVPKSIMNFRNFVPKTLFQKSH